MDKTFKLNINGTKQRVRLCGSRDGLPPVLIVQAGPGFPLLNEVAKFRDRLNLESSFTVAYWDQRGCGRAPLQDAKSVSFASQVDDLSHVVRWLAEETGQQVVVLGISLGATLAWQAAHHETASIKALVAVSIDLDAKESDSSAFAFLQERSRQPGKHKMAQSVKKLVSPPYTNPVLFQLRARLLADSGCIERGMRFGDLLRGLLFSLTRTYGLFGVISTVRNMNTIQGKLLPELAALDLFADWHPLTIPTHYIFGDCDPLVTPSMRKKLAGLMAGHDTLISTPEAGHMVHFDVPSVVRSGVTQAHACGGENLVIHRNR
jgi:pimeloyl-ACP methyl ester carboxylesterase